VSGMSPDLPGAVTFAPGLRGGRLVGDRRSGPTTVMATTLRQGPGTPAGACLCPWEGKGVR
jgi:hypothetical protein